MSEPDATSGTALAWSLRERLFEPSPSIRSSRKRAPVARTLKRTMGLIAHDVFRRSIVGTGIFVILGVAVPQAGPAIIVSFLLAGITCAFSALSYAEMAGSIPISGSSYSYTYATMGELVAWVCGWCLMLEYGVSNRGGCGRLGPVHRRVGRPVRRSLPNRICEPSR